MSDGKPKVADTYRPDFYDRSKGVLRCRQCRTQVDYRDPTFELDESYLDDHVGEAIGCPACGLTSRIPTAEEGEWPERKDPGDRVKDVPVVRRAVEGASPISRSNPNPDPKPVDEGE